MRTKRFVVALVNDAAPTLFPRAVDSMDRPHPSFRPFLIVLIPQVAIVVEEPRLVLHIRCGNPLSRVIIRTTVDVEKLDWVVTHVTHR